MSIIKAVKQKLGMAVEFERNNLNEVEVLIHKASRHASPHGFMLASHRGLGIKSGTVPFVFADLDEIPQLNQRCIADLWEAFLSQGWIPHNLVAYGSLIPLEQVYEHASDDAGTLPPQSIPNKEHAILGGHVDNDYLARVTKTHPMRVPDNSPIVPMIATGTMQDYGHFMNPVMQSYKSRVKHFDVDVRERAYVRFDQIIRNGQQRSDTAEMIKHDLETALQRLAEENDALISRRQVEAAGLAGGDAVVAHH